MLKITDLEHQKLVSLANDEVAIEALKKFFTNQNITLESSDTAFLAAYTLSFVQIQERIEAITKFAEKQDEVTIKKNIV